jgi:hypothetical protein
MYENELYVVVMKLLVALMLVYHVLVDFKLMVSKTD